MLMNITFHMKTRFSFRSHVPIYHADGKTKWDYLAAVAVSTCNPIKQTVACEGQSASLSCDTGFIHVSDANYGRNDGSLCSAGQRREWLTNVHCFQKTSLQTMTTRCNGKKSCSVQAVNSVFSDPCYWTYKYLHVSYLCRPLSKSIIIHI
ncbi:L-rhamnose-binding lectin CSL1-like [Carassius auratus]|uniref:L-rhamnose-binding lectin CSL1-like n=1 Tax=Carassius auratus TaxID=7957 RepID=A0A6P6J7H4_CARAU|nr:L-rhamnose-binding lectin CSL1-like [Carassius auratus]